MVTKKIICTYLMAIPCLMLTHNGLAASHGVFLGGGAGYGSINTPKRIAFLTGSATSGTQTDVVVNKNKHDVGGFGTSAYVGYNFTQNLGVEASYNYYADSDYKSQQTNTDAENSANDTVANSHIEFKAHTYNVVAKGYLPFSNGFELFARAGASYVIQKVNYDTTTSNGTSSFFIPVDNDVLATPTAESNTMKRIRPTAGIGAGFNFTKNIGASFSWNHVFGNGNLKSDKSAIADLDLLTFDLSYTFA